MKSETVSPFSIQPLAPVVDKHEQITKRLLNSLESIYYPPFIVSVIPFFFFFYISRFFFFFYKQRHG